MRTTIILPDGKYKRLKKVAYRRGKSLARTINDAIDRIYFPTRPRGEGIAALYGAARGSPLRDSDLDAVKLRIKAF